MKILGAKITLYEWNAQDHHQQSNTKHCRRSHDTVNPGLDGGQNVVILCAVVQLHREQRTASLAANTGSGHRS